MRRLTILLAAVGALMLVPAAQAFAENQLTVTLGGNGGGEVNSAQGLKNIEEGYPAVYKGTPPLACSYASPGPQTGTCTTQMEESELVFGEGIYGVGMAAVPTPGSEFAGWTVAEGIKFFSSCQTVKGEEESLPENWEKCFVLTNTGQDPQVTATFCLEGTAAEGGAACEEPSTPNLKLNIEEGSGTVVSNPSGLECTGAAPKSCEAAVAEGAVTLTASPAPGYAFKSWKKCDTGGVNGRQCTITAGSSLKEIGAKFVKVWNLDVSKAGSGTGKFQTSPGGILCLYNCGSSEAAFKEGSVTIKQAPAKHNHFVQWLGDCTGSAETCTLNMNEDHSVEAEFAPDTQYALSISKTGGGQASIKSSPSGLLCGYTCGSQTASFYSGETVSIAVTLNKGTSSVEWTTSAGTCTGNALTCTVPMSSAKTLVAKLS